LFLIATAGGSCIAQQTKAQSPPGVVDQRPAEGHFVEVDGKFLIPYDHQIPGTEVTFKMIPVPAGKFKMGAAETDGLSSRQSVTVTVNPFWIGQHEVSWAEYQRYMEMDANFKLLQRNGIRKVENREAVDAVTAPSALYEPDITYEAGEDLDQPAASMTRVPCRYDDEVLFW